MRKVSLAELRSFARTIHGWTLVTRFQDRSFTLAVRVQGFEYTPDRSGESRLQRWEEVELVLDHYNKTGSLQPGDYQDLTRNAFYLLTLIGMFLDEKD